MAVPAVIATFKTQILSPQNTVGWWKCHVRSLSTCHVASAVLYQLPVPGTSGHRIWKERSEPTAALSPKRVSLLSRIIPIQVRTLLAVTRGDPGRDHTYLGGCLVPSPQWGVGWPVAFQALLGIKRVTGEWAGRVVGAEPGGRSPRRPGGTLATLPIVQCA